MDAARIRSASPSRFHRSLGERVPKRARENARRSQAGRQYLSTVVDVTDDKYSTLVDIRPRDSAGRGGFPTGSSPRGFRVSIRPAIFASLFLCPYTRLEVERERRAGYVPLKSRKIDKWVTIAHLTSKGKFHASPISVQSATSQVFHITATPPLPPRSRL